MGSLDADAGRMGKGDDNKMGKQGGRVPRRIRIHRYVEYSPGNTNLVFTVPHDGQTKPASIPTRQNGCRDVVGGVCNYPSSEDCQKPFLCKALLFSDSNTHDFAKRSRAAFTKRTGLVPHFIVSKLHRSKLDPNRAIEDAAQGSPEAEAAYREFHATIRRVQKTMVTSGLLLDFHGQRHGQNSTELGYVYTKSDLNEGNLLEGVSSVSSLLARTGLSPQQLLAGPGSLGALWEEAGYMAIPSPRQPTPGKDKYYRGGYITQTHGSSNGGFSHYGLLSTNHGSSNGGVVDAIQLELPVDLINSTEYRAKMAPSVGNVIAEFHSRYYLS